ncbi:hypothetical protein P2G88_10865 [Aliiglaciecola sp. CAU 1673]|uniref:hypothetical protein n=1 Tax=Aliiglaciecola sp. CAU 1673 TaxID=3032595 RepID=UPI0023D9D970|nr:hypothetical protein [Aliiglaciecola sp. CAU 1673]MDF2178747.1 hypothetical protein [Aliiglaciecola sp. CAU 1673]
MSVQKNSSPPALQKCRCGGLPSQPLAVEGCEDRWLIHCTVSGCQARIAGQGRQDVIKGWNRLSSHLFR